MPDITADIIAIAQARIARLAAQSATASAAKTTPPALGALWAGLNMTKAAPVAVVGLGSSTMAGVGADTEGGRWFNQLAEHLRSAFPNGATESPVGTLSTARVTTPGLHFYNGGVGGTRTTTYLPDSTLTAVAARAPRAVLHMIGSNDVMDGMTADQYRANMIAALDRLDAVVPAPYVNVLMHAHPREGASLTLFAQYRDVLRGLASARANCAFIDAEEMFLAAGLPTPDPLDLLGTDTTHLTQRGHDVMFQIAARGLGVPVTAGSAQAAAPVNTVQRFPLYTDTFSDADAALVTGRPVDNKLGGSIAEQWTFTGTAGEIVLSGGRLARPADGATYVAATPVSYPDYEFSFRMVQLHAANALYIVARRSSPVLSPTPDDYRLTVEGTGGLQLRKRVAGTVTLLGGSSGTMSAGDRIGLRVLGDQISVVHNGVVVSTVTDTSLSAAGWVGVSGSGSASGWIIDDVTVTALVR